MIYKNWARSPNELKCKVIVSWNIFFFYDEHSSGFE